MRITYPLYDLVPKDELAKIGCSLHQVRGKPTGERRPPTEGEWFIDEFNNRVYRAPKGLMASYRIVHLIKGET